MDPRRQAQLINQMLESSAKSEEELNKMTPEEKKEYLRGRLKQKMFFSNAKRQTNVQKQQLQEKMQEQLQEKAGPTPTKTEAQKERNRRKREKKREKMRQMEEEKEDNESSDSMDDIVLVDPNEGGNESDYHSD